MNEIDLQKKIPNSESQKTDIEELGFFKKNNCYFFQSIDRKGNKSNVRVSNFLIESLYNIVNGTNDSTRLIKLQRNTSEINLIELKSSELTNVNFETVLKSQRCTFKGDTFQLKTILEDIMNKERTAQQISLLGYQYDIDCYAFADTIINQDNEVLKINDLGIIEDKENTYYLPAFSQSNIDNDNYQADRLISYQQGDINFEDWAKLTYSTFGSNGMIGLQYIILSLFRDIIYNELGFFPFLFLFGEFGTGKTAFVKNFLGLFGKINDGIDLGNVTVPGVSREISQRTNSIFYLKEFTTDNANTANRVILAGYDGVGRTVGESNSGNGTKKSLPKSGLIFDGNYLPVQKDAIFSRLILLVFESQTFTNEQIKDFETLQKHKENGLSQILKEIISHRKVFKKTFKKLYSKNLKDLTEIKELKGIPNRLLNHISMIVSSYETLSKVLNFPYDSNTLILEIVAFTKKQSEFLSEIRDASIFWKSFSIGMEKKQILENVHYSKTDCTDNLGHIYIKFESLYPYYIQYCKENNYRYVDKISLRELLTSKNNKNFIPANQPSRPNSKAHTVKMNKQSVSAYKFEYLITDGVYTVNGIEINLIGDLF